jgi:hypothetical protein
LKFLIFVFKSERFLTKIRYQNVKSKMTNQNSKIKGTRQGILGGNVVV